MGTNALPIGTERLVLRPPTEDDVDDVFAYRGLDEVVRYLYREPWSRERTREVLAESADQRFEQEGDKLVPVAEVRGTPGVIGDLMLRYASERGRQGEIGWVFSPSVAGRGYATEAARALLDYAFGVVGLHRVYARLDAENDASVRLCKRLGMRQEALLVDSDYYNGRWGSECVYAILGREWAERA